jgi:uncharacterized protein
MAESDALLHLQSVDMEILRSKKRLDELPERAAILKARAKQREVGELKHKGEILVRKLEAELKARQDEISSVGAKIETEQTKLMQTGDHRQVQAISREMDGLKRRVDKLEMESLQYMERIEKATSQVATIEGALVELAAQEAELIEHFRAAGGALQTQIAELEAERAAVASALDPEMLKRYEAVRASKGGVGVGQLANHACTACHMSLPAEKVRDLESGPDVGICPQCRRLIVVRTENAS